MRVTMRTQSERGKGVSASVFICSYNWLYFHSSHHRLFIVGDEIKFPYNSPKMTLTFNIIKVTDKRISNTGQQKLCILKDIF